MAVFQSVSVLILVLIAVLVLVAVLILIGITGTVVVLIIHCNNPLRFIFAVYRCNSMPGFS